MGGSRFGFLGLALILVLTSAAGCTGATGSPSTEPSQTASPTLAATPTPTPAPTLSLAGRFVATGSMIGARSYATATLLPDGKVLIAGGYDVSVSGATHFVAAAELYDPSTHSFTSTGSMMVARGWAAATLLSNGKVLILGGQGCADHPLCNSPRWSGLVPLKSAELYDPATGTFTPTGSMSQPCYACTATLLPDGRVLALSALSKPIEAYDPATGKFTRVGTLSNEYTSISLFASLLPDGKVLVVGTGMSGLEAEVFDPGTGVSKPIPFVPRPAFSEYAVVSATSLRDGRLLIQVTDLRSYLSTFDPSTESFAEVATIDLPRWSSAGAVRLRDGRVLLVGEARGADRSAELEPATGIYDPSSGFHVITARMTQHRLGQTMTLLPDGTVLLAGGDSTLEPVSSAELFVP